MTNWDMGKATLIQSGNRDIPHSKCSTRVCTFMHLELRGRCRDAMHPTSEIGSYISREISCSHDQPVNINHMKY